MSQVLTRINKLLVCSEFI